MFSKVHNLEFKVMSNEEKLIFNKSPLERIKYFY